MGDAGDVMDKAKDTAQSLLSQAKNTAGEAYDKVADRTVSTIEESKAGVTSGLRSVADSVRKVGDNLNTGTEKTPGSEYSARYAQTAASKIEQVAGYFENRDLRGLTRDVESYARRNPAVFIGAAFGLGLLAARFLKSSPTPSVGTGQFSTGVDHQLPENTTGTSRRRGGQASRGASAGQTGGTSAGQTGGGTMAGQSGGGTMPGQTGGGTTPAQTGSGTSAGQTGGGSMPGQTGGGTSAGQTGGGSTTGHTGGGSTAGQTGGGKTDATF